MELRIGKFLLATTLLLAGATAARAQDAYQNTAAWNAGAIVFGDLNKGSGGSGDIKPDAGWVVGLQGDHYWGGSRRFGMRLAGAYTQRSITLPDRERTIGITTADADLMIRLVPPSEANRVQPYIGVGAGVIYYGFGAGERLVFPSAGAVYEGNDHAQFAPVGTFGVDILTNLHWDQNPIGIRLEATDHMALKSPLKPINGGDFDPIHNFRLTLGVFSGFSFFP